jgi:hypothetical protein
MAGDRGRLFLTALLVYAAFLNPRLANAMTWASLDAAVSFVDTGRWQVRHGALYGDRDVALSGTRPVVGPPPGLAVALVPVYAVWKPVDGAVDGLEGFGAFHVFATLVLGATASALAAGEAAALLFAFGTPAFLFATAIAPTTVTR